MLGREAPLEFFRRSGIAIAGEGTLRGWIAVGILRRFLHFRLRVEVGWVRRELAQSLAGKHAGPFSSSLGGWFQSQVANRSTLLGTLAVSLKSRSFYYTLLYSSLIVGFGIARIRRRRTRYVTLQTIALMLVQVIPLFILPEIILPWLGYNGWFDHGFGKTIADHLFESYIPETQYAAHQWPAWGHPRAYWRAYGFILALAVDAFITFSPTPPLWFRLVIGFLQTFVIIPAPHLALGKRRVLRLDLFHCGALAETMGDNQRPKMPTGPFWNPC